MKRRFLKLMLISALSIIATILTSTNCFGAATSPTFYQGRGSAYEVITNLSNGGNSYCMTENTGGNDPDAPQLQLSTQDWQAGKYNVNGEAIMPVEMAAKDGWYLWRCFPNDDPNSSDMYNRSCYICATDQSDSYHDSEGIVNAVCSDNQMRPQSDISQMMSQIDGGPPPEVPIESEYDRFVSSAFSGGNIEAAQQSNGGDAICAAQYTLVPGRIDCHNEARTQYWSCFIAESTEGYAVDCEKKDKWTSEPPDYTGYPNYEITTPARDQGEEGLPPKCEDQNRLGVFMCSLAQAMSDAVDAMINFVLVPMLQWRIAL